MCYGGRKTARGSPVKGNLVVPNLSRGGNGHAKMGYVFGILGSDLLTTLPVWSQTIRRRVRHRRRSGRKSPECMWGTGVRARRTPTSCQQFRAKSSKDLCNSPGRTGGARWDAVRSRKETERYKKCGASPKTGTCSNKHGEYVQMKSRKNETDERDSEC
jgi:hypothetical protein